MVSPGEGAYADARDTNAEGPILSISSTESDSDDSLCSSMDARQARLPHGAAAAAGAPWWWRIAVKRALGAKPRPAAGGARDGAWGPAAALGGSPLAEVRLMAGPRASEPDALSSAGSEDAARDGADQPKQRPGGQATPRWRARGQHRLHHQLQNGFRDLQQQQQAEVEQLPLLPHLQHPRGAASDAERGAAAPAVARAAAAAAPAPSAHYLPGVRYHTECMPRRWWSAVGWEVLGIMSLIGYMAIPLHFTIIFLRAVTGDARAAVFGSAILATLLLPAKPLMWAPFLEWVLLKSIRQYFDYSVLVEDPPALEQRAIWAEYPHGVFPLSQLLAVSLNPTRWPGLRAHSVGASVLFRVPLWRQMLGWMGIRPASRRHFTRLLLDKGAVKVNPGGIAEMYLLQRGAEVIKLADRKGFVRIAVETGAPILPVYHFGQSRMLNWHSFKLLETLSRRLRVSLGIITGRWGLPLPFKIKLMAVVGTPVTVRQVAREDPGFDAAVDEAHAAYVAALTALYHRHRDAYGWRDRPLVIV